MRGREVAAEVKIVTDSSSYLEPDVIKKYDISIVPIKVTFGSEVFREGVDITKMSSTGGCSEAMPSRLPPNLQQAISFLFIDGWSSRGIPFYPSTSRAR